jgi:flagellar biosynthetic protein FlhB
MADQDMDRNEDATPYKLQKAREKGQVSKSADVVSALVLVVAVTFLAWQGWDMTRAQFRLDQMVLLQSTVRDPGGAALWPLVARAIQDTLLWLAPFCAAVVIAALLGNVLQTGPILSSEPITVSFWNLPALSISWRMLPRTSTRPRLVEGRKCVSMPLRS